MYETFDHTADVGIRAAAPDLPGIFREAARGLLSLLVEDVETVQPAEELSIELCEPDREYLLFDWLRELLYLFDARQFLASGFEIVVADGRLRAKVRGERIDAKRHRLAHEVKAITSHGLMLRQAENGYEAEYIVDI
jgi:SHS2 domain-containing protein